MTDEDKPAGDEDSPAGEQAKPTSDQAPKEEQQAISFSTSEDDEEKKGGCISPLGLLVLFGIAMVLAAIMVPNFIRARSRGQLTACKSNLKNIGTAFEMYSTDWSGKYPTSLDLLTPNYLKTIPDCPAAGTATYRMQTGTNVAYNTPGFQDYYFVECAGDHHSAVAVPTGYPQYDGLRGLIER